MTKTAHIVLGAPDVDAAFPEPASDDVVIGVDKGAVECQKRKLPVTLALGDFDSISKDERENLREYAASMEEYEAKKDDTDTELALIRTVDLFQPEKIIIYNWLGGRTDHLFSLLFLVHQPRFEPIVDKLVFQNTLNTITFYKPGGHVVRKERSKRYISFIGMTPVKNLTLNKLKYPLKNASYDYPVSLVSNEMLEETCDFSFDEGIIAVIQSGDNKLN